MPEPLPPRETRPCATPTIAIILNYRTSDETIAAAHALGAAGFPASFIIIVDNASADGSVERLQGALPDLRLLVARDNGGFSAGCNLGIREALRLGAGRVLLLNSDITVQPGTVERLEGALAGDPRLGIVGPTVIAREDPDLVESVGISYNTWTGRMWHDGHARRVRAMAAFDLRVVDGISGCAMMIRREVFDAIGLLAEEYFFGFEDLDFCLRARAAGFASACAGTATVLHEGHASIGRRSPDRVYFAARNHLLLAQRVAGPQPWLARALRPMCIVALNLAHVLVRAEVPRRRGLAALVQGVRDHRKRRYGACP